jgi:hypothetical protein
MPKIQSISITLPITQRLTWAIVKPVSVPLPHPGSNGVTSPTALAPSVAHTRAVVDGVSGSTAQANGSAIAPTIFVGVAAARATAQGTTCATACPTSMAHASAIAVHMAWAWA